MMLASMMSETLSQTNLLIFPLVTVVLFVAIFAGAVLWICRRGAREVYEERGRLVFEDGTRTQPPTPTRPTPDRQEASNV